MKDLKDWADELGLDWENDLDVKKVYIKYIKVKHGKSYRKSSAGDLEFNKHVNKNAVRFIE